MRHALQFLPLLCWLVTPSLTAQTLIRFQNGTIADADEVNSNFNALLNRTDLTGANIVDRSLTAADVSTRSGRVTHAGGLDVGAAASFVHNNAAFRFWSFPPGNGYQLLAGFITENNAAPQIRFAGRGSGFIDLGEDSSRRFVVETSDTPRLTIDESGRVLINRSTGFGNIQFETNYTGSSAGFAGAFRNTRRSGSGGAALVGNAASSGDFAVLAEGRLGATGTKSFIQPHPLDPSKQVQFVCLEGNESGTYFRGKTKLHAGRAVIDVPEDFRLVSEPENLTVQLTPIGRGSVWVESYGLNQITIAGEWDVEVHYMVNGVRRGFANLETIQENTAFRPRTRGEAYGTQYPKELRDILIKTGILNADLTPNENTARRLGWSLAEPSAPITEPVQQPTGQWR